MHRDNLLRLLKTDLRVMRASYFDPDVVRDDLLAVLDSEGSTREQQLAKEGLSYINWGVSEGDVPKLERVLTLLVHLLSA